MFSLIGVPTQKQIAMISEACQGLNKLGSVVLGWLIRLITPRWLRRTYRQHSREGRRRRDHRAAMDAWAEDYISSRFDATEVLLMLQLDFLTDARGAIQTTGVCDFHDLIPDLDYFIWTTGEPAKKISRWEHWRLKLKLWLAGLNEGVKIVAICYLTIIGVVLFAVGFVVVVNLIWHSIEQIHIAP